MLKPKLQNSALPSTAISKNMLSNSYVPTKQTSMKPTVRESYYSSVPSFSNQHFRQQQSQMDNKQQSTLQRERRFEQESSLWINTSDIESVIRKRIDTDAELSVERNLEKQRYSLGADRICAQKILPIPEQIRLCLEQGEQHNEKQHVVYGYLSSLNGVYYIIQQDLFIFSLDELRTRSESKMDTSNLIEYKPTKLRPNCRKIYEIQFPVCDSMRMIPKEFNGKVLILEYPYQIQICAYSIHHAIKNNLQGQYQKQPTEPKKFITLINLNVRIPLQTISAEFITVTSKGQLLYLDEKGKVVCFQLSKQDDTRIKRKTHLQNTWKKKTFISRNRSFLRAAKTYFWQALDFRHSLFLSRRKNLSMIYDDRRNRIYTLTIHGDRTTMIQKLRKELKVYEFLNTGDKVELNCIMSVPQEELLTEFGIEAQKSPTNLFTILKSEADYNQESDLIALLSNGTKVHIQFTEEKLKVISLSICPDIESLRKSSKQRKQRLVEISKDFMSRDQISKMERELGQKIEIKRSQYGELRVKAYFNDRGLSVGLVRVDRQYSMYMTIKKAMGSGDQFDVFPIEWRNKSVFQDIERFPTENEIFAFSNQSNESSVMQQILNVQKASHSSKINIYERQFRTPRPKSENCHQLLRQVHHGPHGFVYLSNKFITNFSLLRPIDIVEMMVINREEAFCEMYLPLILGLEPYEICCILIQLYCCKTGTYYSSKNYKYKINALIDRLKQNAQRIHSINEKSVLSRISLSNQLKTGQQQIFQEKQDDKLQSTNYSEKSLQGNKSKFRKQFVIFSKLQQIKDPNPFQKIKLSFQTISMSSTLEDKIDKLNEEHRCQAQHCLLYLSRVLYPFWTVKLTSREISKYALRSIKEKILETLGIVELLQVEFNEYWSHLQAFVTKLVQIIEMFLMLSQLPPELTLEQAVSKDPTYFEPYIFTMLKRETNPEMIKLFQHRCPIYISLYFETLIKVYSEVKITANLEQIQSILGRLPQYPDYFLDFLKEEKGFKDLSFLKMKNEITHTVMRLKIPDLPLQNLIPYFHSRVKSTSVKMNEKFLYLKEARKKINSCKSPQMRKIEVFCPYVIEKFEKQYDTLFKCLKFQQMCKNQIIRIFQEGQDEYKQSDHGQRSGFFKKILSKLSFSSKRENDLNQKRLSLIAKRQSMNKIQNQNQQIFRKLNYFVLQKQELKGLIGQIGSPKLNIVYSSIFSPRGINEDEKKKFRKNSVLSYIELVNFGAKKWKIQMDPGLNQRQNFSKFLNFIRSEVKEIYMCLNATQTFPSFGPLYQGIKQQLINYEDTLTSILQNDVECIFSVGRELIELGFDRNTVLNDIELGNIHRTLRNQDLQSENESIFVLKSLVYDLYMGVDAARKFKKEKLDAFLQIIKDVIELKSNSLERYPQYKDFLIRMKQMLFNIINGNCENEIDRRTILEKMISKVK